MTIEKIREAVAQGWWRNWCIPHNHNKVMDVYLAEAIAQSVYKLVNKKKKKNISA